MSIHYVVRLNDTTYVSMDTNLEEEDYLHPDKNCLYHFDNDIVLLKNKNSILDYTIKTILNSVPNDIVHAIDLEFIVEKVVKPIYFKANEEEVYDIKTYCIDNEYIVILPHVIFHIFNNLKTIAIKHYTMMVDKETLIYSYVQNIREEYIILDMFAVFQQLRINLIDIKKDILIYDTKARNFYNDGGELL